MLVRQAVTGARGGVAALLVAKPRRIGGCRQPCLPARAMVVQQLHSSCHARLLVNDHHYRTVWWGTKDQQDTGDSHTVSMIEQRRLPHNFEVVELSNYVETAAAIKTMVVRGAGAIGATAGFAMAQAAMAVPASATATEMEQAMNEAAVVVEAARPTAQNLFFAVRTVKAAALETLGPGGGGISDGLHDRFVKAAVSSAQAIADDDAACCKAIGEHGAVLFEKHGHRVSTHCNAGWLAFVDWGSALSPIFVANAQASTSNSKQKPFVWVDETRPRLQGANLTAWELEQQGILHAVIADNATGHYMRTGEVDFVIVGSDRIAANGDVVNKIGTYSSAVCAAANGIPFYVAAPTTTIDPNSPTGDAVEIEERDGEEVQYTTGVLECGTEATVRTTSPGSPARNPAFDVTPAHLVAGIITEHGIVPATPEGIAKVARYQPS